LPTTLHPFLSPAASSVMPCPCCHLRANPHFHTVTKVCVRCVSVMIPLYIHHFINSQRAHVSAHAPGMESAVQTRAWRFFVHTCTGVNTCICQSQTRSNKIPSPPRYIYILTQEMRLAHHYFLPPGARLPVGSSMSVAFFSTCVLSDPQVEHPRMRFHLPKSVALIIHTSFMRG
jgi:hypothetical protein